MYLKIVLKEQETTSTYEKVNVCCEEVIQKHFEYMMSSDIKVEKTNGRFACILLAT